MVRRLAVTSYWMLDRKKSPVLPSEQSGRVGRHAGSHYLIRSPFLLQSFRLTLVPAYFMFVRSIKVYLTSACGCSLRLAHSRSRPLRSVPCSAASASVVFICGWRHGGTNELPVVHKTPTRRMYLLPRRLLLLPASPSPSALGLTSAFNYN